MSRPARALRGLLQAVLFRVPSLFSRTTVAGRENLSGTATPVIFIANHVSHYDTLYLIRAIPRRLRKVAAAAAADVMYEVKPGYSRMKRLEIRLRGFGATLALNAFPFSRDVHVKKSFEYMGQLLDQGWNILLFPEGKLTETGEMDRFKSGIGLLAQAMRVPVVPIRQAGLWAIVGGRRLLPRRFGRVRITFGKPMSVDEGADPEQVARRFEGAIRDLS